MIDFDKEPRSWTIHRDDDAEDVDFVGDFEFDPSERTLPGVYRHLTGVFGGQEVVNLGLGKAIVEFSGDWCVHSNLELGIFFARSKGKVLVLE